LSAVTVRELNAMDRASFVAALEPVAERSPWVVDRAWRHRPFVDREALVGSLRAALVTAPEDQKLALIRAHPDLAGRAAIAGELTAESAREQASAELDRLTPAEFERFHRLNDAYQARFGFPFIICVREHTKSTILEAFEARLQHDRQAEVATAIDQVARIVRLRLLDLVTED
jgi:2-oxo-4-hydroxy-4-carboxy-5-ureidoimidazoline decarboxylase